MKRDKLIIIVLASVLLALLYTILDSTDRTEEYPTAQTTKSSKVSRPREGTTSQDVTYYTPGDCLTEVASPSDWVLPEVPESLQGLPQEDPQLAEHICRHWLLPPSTKPRQLALEPQDDYSQWGQSQTVDQLLKRKRRGFYVESGAADGEGLSNTLFFELNRNWSGLLVEANPSNFRGILQRRRHAYTVNACLSPTKHSMVLPFSMAGYIGGISDYMPQIHRERVDNKFKDNETVNVQCFPLFSILRAMGVSHIDYFSLDIEGAEIEILETLPFDDITIETFSIEYVIPGNGTATKEKLRAITEILVDRHGYSIARLGPGQDVILKKNR